MTIINRTKRKKKTMRKDNPKKVHQTISKTKDLPSDVEMKENSSYLKI